MRRRSFLLGVISAATVEALRRAAAGLPPAISGAAEGCDGKVGAHHVVTYDFAPEGGSASALVIYDCETGYEVFSMTFNSPGFGAAAPMPGVDEIAEFIETRRPDGSRTVVVPPADWKPSP